MDPINDLIKQSFDAVSLILVFVFVMFGISYPQITAEIKKEIPVQGRPEERRQHRGKLTECLVYKDLPLVVIYGVLFYLFLPLLLRVLSESRFQLWNFDISRTTYVVVDLFILMFFLWSVYLALRLYQRIAKSK